MAEGDRKEIEFYQRLDEVTHYLWDPIGVAGAPEARDEYYGYLPRLFELVKGESSLNEIADYLGWVTSNRMDLGTNRDRDLKIAEILVRWKKHLVD
jgi:hypothetical protein